MEYSWAKCYSEPAKEFQQDNCEVLEGNIPTDLKGTLYRNGPAILARGGEHMGHWFDGDGAILSVRFNEGKAQSLYRFVQTEVYKKEEEHGKLLSNGYGTTTSFFRKLFNSTAKDQNRANTSVLPLKDRLLALWEGGFPVSLDLDTLKTLGSDDLGFLGKSSFSAHPKVDEKKKVIYNFGFEYGKTTYLNVFKFDY